MPSLSDIIVTALKDLLRDLFEPVTRIFERHVNNLLDIIVGTPYPDRVFVRPTNFSWPAIYDYYWEAIVPLALLLWAVSIGLVIFLESTSYLFSNYHRTKLKKRAFSGLLGILAWWWIAALSLQFVNALTGYLVPDLSEVSLFQTLSFSAMGVLGLVVSLGVDLILFVLIALIYFTRQVVLYLFVLLMPLLIVFWIPGVGPFALVSRFMKQLAGFYVPFLFMTVPVAVLFRLGELLGSSFGFSMGGIGAWIIALIIPVVAVVSPFVLVWQAGAVFFIGDRAARHVSAERARKNVQRGRAAGGETAHAGRNFKRGVRGQPAVRDDGQYLMDASDSRAHAAGSRLRSTGSRLRGALPRSDGGGGGGNQVGGGGSSGGADSGESTSESSPSTDRSSEFETLRGERGDAGDRHRPHRESSDPDQSDDTDDETPRYIN